MKAYIIDLAGISLFGVALALGAIAIYIFDTKVSAGLAHAIVSAFR